MGISTRKFSQFLNKVMAPGDRVVGLSSGVENSIFDAENAKYTNIPTFPVNGISQVLIPNTRWVTSNLGLITFTLPEVCEFADVFEIVGFSAGGWKIVQNANQQIFVGFTSTTQGVSGYIQSTNMRDSIFLMCVAANTSFVNLTPPQGNPIAN